MSLTVVTLYCREQAAVNRVKYQMTVDDRESEEVGVELKQLSANQNRQPWMIPDR